MAPDAAAPRRLTRPLVVREAMAVLDEAGYDALTMRRLAERLGVVPMAVYRHVANKDDLTDALLDLAVSEVPLPPPGLDWRGSMRHLAHAIRDTVLAHPGIVTPLVGKPALGPSSLALAEAGFAALADAGFSPAATTRGVNAVLTYTIGFVALEVPRRRAGFLPDGSGADGLDDDLDRLPPDLFPYTRALRPAPAELVNDAQFQHGLDRLLDGIGADAPTP